MDDTNLTHSRAGEAEGTDELFSDTFMRKNTQFESWEQFKRKLAATPRHERDAFVMRTTRFACFSEMESAALGLGGLLRPPSPTPLRWAAW